MALVALRGTDGIGDDAVSSPVVAVVPKTAMNPLTILLWVATMGTIGYIFWGTLQPVKRKKPA